MTNLTQLALVDGALVASEPTQRQHVAHDVDIALHRLLQGETVIMGREVEARVRRTVEMTMGRSEG